MTYKLHKQIPSNTKGRDFIIADLHGCLELFEERLESVNFDEHNDRVLSVGDLNDRGPDSMGCLRLLHKPWFHAVRGNHEQMLIDYAYPYDSTYSLNQISMMFINNGGDWVHKLTKAEQKELWDELVPMVSNLPYVITVGEGTEKFHIVHAELITQGKSDVESQQTLNLNSKDNSIRVLTDDEITEENLMHMTDVMVWGRRIAKDFKASRATAWDTKIGRLLVGKNLWHKGLSLTYCGHTIVNSARINRSHLMIDRSHLMIDRGAFLQGQGKGKQLLFLEHTDVLSSLPSKEGN